MNPPKRGKMWRLAHAGATKLMTGFDNIVVNEPQYSEMASVDVIISKNAVNLKSEVCLVKSWLECEQNNIDKELL